ncbi:amidohydrolase family protein [Sphingobium sp. HBC34]|uniref:Amidohydrolase family protein n=1 Tax=Sphingobium cyanobacteriorum TaxID=3063954 RepID=A0ABT8ZMW1_9SPHN|nr:amidohydrolase family protein [Sphingobium sp. HBC34]MDO7835463.1 amidohydrolase family protein [Sphingobium sp. HBC34]
MIAAISKDLGPVEAKLAIDANGLIVAPRAIDPHAHFDAQVHWDPYCSPRTSHGATTTLITRCGFGQAPARPEMRESTMAMMESTERVLLAALAWTWETFPEWMAHLKALLNEAMDLGAAGFSFSRMLDTSNHTDFDGTPMPTDIRPPEDFYALAAVLGWPNGCLIACAGSIRQASEAAADRHMLQSIRTPPSTLIVCPVM